MRNRPMIPRNALFWLPAALAAAALAAAIPRAGGDDPGREIERGLGQVVAQELEAAYGVVDDPLLTPWVDRLGQRLARAAGRSDAACRFRILDSEDVNALAAPGGPVYLNRGLLRFIQSEDELASVVGHEVGHVAGRHAMKQLTAQVLGTLVLLGFQAVGAETLKSVGSIAGSLALLKFSRDEENDADRRGLRAMTAAGYDGAAMLAFFRRLQATEKHRPGGLEVYFLTHPPTAERIRCVSADPASGSSAPASLGDGLARRFLFRQAAEAYRRALAADSDNMDLKLRLAEALRSAPRRVKGPGPFAARLEESRQRLERFAQELEAALKATEPDRAAAREHQKSIDHDLERAAQALASASQMILRRDTVQARGFLRMARSFDRATRAAACLRAAQDMTSATENGMRELVDKLRAGLQQDDGLAAPQADGLALVGHAFLTDLAASAREARLRADDTRRGVHTLRLAVESLLSSYRLPFGFTSGQFDILDLQVSTAQDTLADALKGTRAAASLASKARMGCLVLRINCAARGVPPGDAATSGLVAHYLGGDPAAVRRMRERLELGDAALACAGDLAASRPKGGEIKWQNAVVLFELMARDIEREIEG